MRFRPFALLALSALGSAFLVSCGGDAPSEPAGPPAQVVAQAGSGQTGAVAAPLTQPLTVKVTDAKGRGVGGIGVTWSAAAGGKVTAAAPATDKAGIATATWTLGKTSGAQTATATFGQLTPATFSATATSSAPAAVATVSGDQQEAVVTSALPAPLVARVRDSYGNGVANVPVSWLVVSGGGSLSSTSSVTDAAGEAQVQMTLGKTAGTQLASAMITGLPSATFTLRGVADVAATVTLPLDSVRLGQAGDTASLQPSAIDTHGNSVQASALTWTSRDADVATVSASGVVTAAGNGATRIVASSASGAADSVVVHVGKNMVLAGLHVTQAVQTVAGTVPLVKDRPGLLRVFVTSSADNTDRPAVRVRIYRNGALIDTQMLTHGASGIPRTVNTDQPVNSWNLVLPASMVQPGLAVLAEVDPDNQIPDLVAGDNVFPRSGTPLALDVRTVPRFDVLFVPVHQSTTGRTGNVTAGNADNYLVHMRKWFPIVDIDHAVRAPYVTNAQPLESTQGGNLNAWEQILNEIRALRVAESGTRYYYGVVSPGYNSGYAGLGNLGMPTAMGWDLGAATATGGSNSRVAAHEWGHNFNRLHAPCGGAAQQDGNYPYSGGISGHAGFDIVTNDILPSTTTDVMGYCGNQWISDYNYKAVLNFRGTSGAQGSVASGMTQNTLLVWGRTGPEGLVLEPAFEAPTVPVLPTESGSYRLEGFDAAGARLFSLNFEPTKYGDAPGGSFAFALPEALAQTDRLASLRVSGAGRSAERRQGAGRETAPGRQAASPVAVARRAQRGNVALEWNAGDYPMAIVRDAATGRIISFARGGKAALPAAGAALDLVFSDGVRSVSKRVSVQ